MNEVRECKRQSSQSQFPAFDPRSDVAVDFNSRNGVTCIYMTPLKQTNFRLEEELLDALQQIRERDGIPVAEQVRRAIRNWIDSKDVNVKTPRKVPVSRKRS